MIKHICFDFDGVILDSLNIHLQTMDEAFGMKFTREEFGVFLDGNFIDSKIGKLDWNKYHEHLAPKYQEQIFEEDVLDGLHSLSNQYQLSINSTGGNDMLNMICKANDVDNLFCEIWGANTEQYKTKKFKMLMEKHDLSEEEILFVTDTLGDVREAHEVGIASIAITGGYHDREKLESGQPFAIVDSWQELQEVIKKASQK